MFLFKNRHLFKNLIQLVSGDLFMNLKSKINNVFKVLLNFLKKYKYIFLLLIPFFILDFATRFILTNANLGQYFYFVPTLFTLLWSLLFLGICLCLKSKIGRKLYIFFVVISILLFLVNGIYYSTTDTFFDFILLGLASEGSVYFIDSILNTPFWIYLVSLLTLILSFVILKFYPKIDVNNFKYLGLLFISFFAIHIIIPMFYGKANMELTWNTWRNKRNIYINFNDNNKSMDITGLYEYTFRNFYITFLKKKESNNEIELSFLEGIFNNQEETHNNEYTGIFKDKNVIFLQLEGLDDWLLTKEITPNLYSLLNNSYVFNDHYSYYNGGGSTFNSEFAVNTGYITPFSYTQNAYTFNKNLFNYSMANLFKNEGYIVNGFHMNSSDYYSRGINYRNWGFDNYYSLKDLGEYENNLYYLDTELINNQTFYDLMFHSDKKFVNYLITYSIHLPFNSNKGVCKMILDKNGIDLSLGEVIFSEEDCIKLQAKETDDMVGLLMQALKDNNLYDNTVLVVFTDHYLYTVTDDAILEKYKNTENNLINKTPFFIWSSNTKKKVINKTTSQLNILPTVLNLFGLEYKSNYYIGSDALDSNYKGIVLFDDFSWYDGNVYVSDGLVTNGGEISSLELEEKNSYVDYIIKKNDLVLKYDYFEVLKNNKVLEE